MKRRNFLKMLGISPLLGAVKPETYLEKTSRMCNEVVAECEKSPRANVVEFSVEEWTNEPATISIGEHTASMEPADSVITVADIERMKRELDDNLRMSSVPQIRTLEEWVLNYGFKVLKPDALVSSVVVSS